MLLPSVGVPNPAIVGNLLLARLTVDDLRLVQPHLRHVEFMRGEMVFRAGEPIQAILFPEAGLLSLGNDVGRSHVEVALVGREGMLGWPALLGCRRSAHDAVAQGEDGSAFSLDLDRLADACRASATLRTTLLTFVQAVMIQMARTIASQIESTLEQRIARWILMRHDRVGGDQVVIRHDEIAGALNARRASITDRLHLLEGRWLIRCRRGRLIVRDRAALEQFAGDAYGAAERTYRELIGPFGKSPAALERLCA